MDTQKFWKSDEDSIAVEVNDYEVGRYAIEYLGPDKVTFEDFIYAVGAQTDAVHVFRITIASRSASGSSTTLQTIYIRRDST